MSQFRISNVFLDSKHLKFAVFPEFQRHLIMRYSFKEPCFQHLKEDEFAGQSHGPGAQPTGRAENEGGELPSSWLRSVSVKGTEKQGVVGSLLEEKPQTNGSPD